MKMTVTYGVAHKFKFFIFRILLAQISEKKLFNRLLVIMTVTLGEKDKLNAAIHID